MKMYADFVSNEKYWTEKELKIPKLNDHLTEIFKDFGYSVKYEENKRIFWKDSVDNYLIISFYIRSGRDSLTINMENDDIFVQFLPIYLKTINGLIVKYYVKGNKQFEVYISDDSNIDDIKNQISKNDFELKLKINKYNI